MEERDRSRIAAALGVAASLVAILTFVTGRFSLMEFLPARTRSAPMQTTSGIPLQRFTHQAADTASDDPVQFVLDEVVDLAENQVSRTYDVEPPEGSLVSWQTSVKAERGCIVSIVNGRDKQAKECVGRPTPVATVIPRTIRVQAINGPATFHIQTRALHSGS